MILCKTANPQHREMKKAQRSQAAEQKQHVAVSWQAHKAGEAQVGLRHLLFSVMGKYLLGSLLPS